VISAMALAVEEVPAEVQSRWMQRRSVNWTEQVQDWGASEAPIASAAVRWGECTLFIATGEDKPQERALFEKSFKRVVSKYDLEHEQGMGHNQERRHRGQDQGNHSHMRGAADALLDFEVCRRADLHLGTCGSLWDLHLHHLREVDAVGTNAQSFMYNLLLPRREGEGAGGAGLDQQRKQPKHPRPFCGPLLHQQQLGLPACDSPCAATGG
jgi:hypothetical protein